MSRRIVVFAPNWLGDAVMALPAMADIRRADPHAAIDVAARASIAPLVPLIPGVERAVVCGDRDESIAAVRAGGYDVAILFPNSFSAAWIAHRAGIAERWGFRRQLRGPLLTRAIARPRRVHQAEYYQRLTTALGCAPGLLQPRLHVPTDLATIGEERLVESGWDGGMPLVAVAPGAAYGGAKRWPAARFAATIDALARDGIRAVLTGATSDAQAAADVLGSVHTGLRPIDLVGATDLSTLAGVLVHCRALVTNDSGAMHFAAAVGVNVTAVFGPTNERATGPLGVGHMAVLHTDVWCRPCMLRECPLRHRCMTGVSVDAVVAETRAGL